MIDPYLFLVYDVLPAGKGIRPHQSKLTTKILLYIDSRT